MQAVELFQNPDGSWTARIYSLIFTGSYTECQQWLRWQGEYQE